jgi:hypothetical protein
MSTNIDEAPYHASSEYRAIAAALTLAQLAPSYVLADKDTVTEDYVADKAVRMVDALVRRLVLPAPQVKPRASSRGVGP